MNSPRLRSAVFLASALAMSGCVSLLPASKAVDLYDFTPAFAARKQSLEVPSVNVRLDNGQFAQAAAGDRIATLTDAKVAYVAGARWAAPAQTLFGQAVTAAFAARPGPARPLRRGDPGLADYILSLDVTHFETRYPAPGAAPTVQVTVHALLVRAGDQKVAGEQTFQASVNAGANRIPAIVGAYGTAVGRTLDGLSGWVQERLAAPK
jgi:cholesterol transport system auxiliary component